MARRQVTISNETLGRSPVNALAEHERWLAAKGDARKLVGMATGMSQAARPQALPKWADAALLWYVSDGKYGLAFPHMLDAEEVNLYSFVDDTDVDAKVRRRFAEVMAQHPSKEIATSWARELARMPQPETPKAKARK